MNASAQARYIPGFGNTVSTEAVAGAQLDYDAVWAGFEKAKIP
ncbi:hypothetical protein [Sphingomonas sp. QA11]|nr:hypothetical protein [Sphingomonas sp. QA11]